MPSDKRKFGDIGESLAVRFLMKCGFEIVDRNYQKKWGEIDIVSRETLGNGFKYRFIEVKTVSCENIANISHETLLKDTRPEEQVHVWKKKRLSRAVESYILEHKISHETPWQCDLVAVFLDKEHKQAKIRVVENILLE
jgi:putative endonuclease